MLMSHSRAKCELNVNESGSDDCNVAEIVFVSRDRYRSSPYSRSHQRNYHNQTEEGLSETGMKDSYLILQHRDPQSAEYALQNNGQDGGQPEHSHPATGLRKPQPHGQNDREKPHA